MSITRDLVDPESRVPLEQLLEAMPGGFNAIPDIAERRATITALFAALEVWDQVAAGAQPILDMVVTDSKLEDSTRPVFLTFAGNVQPGEPSAHMVENRHLIDPPVVRARREGTASRAPPGAA